VEFSREPEYRRSKIQGSSSACNADTGILNDNGDKSIFLCGGDEMNFHITLFGKFNPIADEIAKNAPQF
jgi:hypothetical protein